MVKITEQLIRKKSEHNELIIGTLEEISLHQEDIEKIEHIQNWCRELKILLLQNNLISRIENVHKLKKLEYLNLAINNIEKIENLEKLESLQKLDLTLNFIGELTGVETLQENYNLENLILTGNPCTDFPGYRNYVIVTLPQLKVLDGIEITRSNRLLAQKTYDETRKRITQSIAEYRITRDEQKVRVQKQSDADELNNKDLSEDDKIKKFWETKSENCPETRIEMAKVQKKTRNVNNNNNSVDSAANNKEKERKLKLFADCGRPYNLNEAKIEFCLADERDYYELDLHIYKFLDTSLINVDIETNYVRITIKKKIFQMAFNEEIRVSDATSQRSMITGHLLIWMPKLNYKENFKPIQRNDLDSKRQKIKKSTGGLTGIVDYKNIVIDESKVPPLI